MMMSKLEFVLATLLVAQAGAIRWEQEPNTIKCLRESVQANIIVTGEYEVSEAPGQRVDYIVSVFLQFIKKNF